MKDYSHIEEYEEILERETSVLSEVERALDLLDAHPGDYEKLIEWYGSDEWRNDMEDDGKGLLPEGLKRGVLSEDGIWNFSKDHYQLGLRLMETGLRMVKQN